MSLESKWRLKVATAAGQLPKICPVEKASQGKRDPEEIPREGL
jgi:hypothetical protein